MDDWTAPSPVQATIESGKMTSLSGTYTIVPSGSLQVTLLPAEAVTAGAQWRVDSGAWQDSGAIVNDLSEGQHQVEFLQVNGWTAPDSEQVTITSGQTMQISRNYMNQSLIKHAAGDFDGDGRDEIAMDFGSTGAWMYDSGVWSQLTSYNPENMIPFDVDGNGDKELAIDLGTLGLWMWNNGIWSQLTVNSPEYMIATDTNANGIDRRNLRLWSIRLGVEARKWGMVRHDLSYDPQNIMAVDVDNNRAYEVVAEFGSVGMWIWEGIGITWYRMSSSDPNTMTGVDAYATQMRAWSRDSAVWGPFCGKAAFGAS